ncbi:type 2 isopentenyl-diphosphate Delta-isomerase [Fructilactobacillus lindneri]|uniref:Isopentenyl-diphosphate delta-isomerase n=2 Tax=Fructilactobacillus lindneri TaxID=53444 RepID=A0A0R2JPD2_9LACO|nr:type 2 isopentenyl-diphosphate Delta-isomerase [Fructilactobacillus lindneri]ANZ58198.1 type 2 isopentenyl-diphosphate Delta-isomerase [Fructilactobacillus lindneri]ANZ59519.1 type 2 isopentenyl-diphosphate Delta-isomerase [Fructilactobacillus lindneri]KRN79022.1 Isopentenyl-diphosphate delta-isomerase [Fructilactobacillus lindneri DSM 20690 = JCM 11027]POG98697.1 type 2 isopentenyl-diphosphate Delta-isomerase [Fructilactobacillus lindneri]POH04085.1 type 2 isopentenyl-diphosphate Delta-iso
MLNQHSHRKDEHVSLAKKFHQENSNAGFDDIRFMPNSLPEISKKEVDISTQIGNLKFNIPFYIEAMTGGSDFTKKLNQKLAKISKDTGIAMAVGSESVALKYPETSDSFTIARKVNPKGILIANLGADVSLDEVDDAIKLIDANAIEIHINAVQEIIMPEGASVFKWIDNIQKIVEHVTIPVIIKEVGFGMDSESLQRLKNISVKYVNIGGRGGTNFAQIENFRRKNKEMKYLKDWGINTVQSLYESQKVNGVQIIATGGITNPLEIVKSLYLGADAVGIASEILVSLIDNGVEKTEIMINSWIDGIKSIFTILGVQNIQELRTKKTVLSPELLSYLQQRHIK